MKRNYFCMLFLLIFVYGNISGEELIARSQFKSRNLLLPIKIVVSNGLIYILDKGDESIKVFNIQGELMVSFGKKGEAPGEFYCAADFFVDNGRVYVLDTCKSKIEIFLTQNGSHISTRNLKISNPFKIAIDNGKIFVSSISFLKGQKIITSLVEEAENFKIENSFLECIPLEGIELNKIYKNAGVLTANKGKLYFAYILSNKILEFSDEGKLLKEYFIPIKSIEKLEIGIKNNQMLLKSALNYDIRAKRNKIFLLSRNEKGESFIFELKNGKFQEKFKIRDKIISFDITDNEILGIEEEKGEVLIYKVN